MPDSSPSYPRSSVKLRQPSPLAIAVAEFIVRAFSDQDYAKVSWYDIARVADNAIEHHKRTIDANFTENEKFQPVVDFFNRACDVTAVAAAQVRRSNEVDAAAFVRHCLASNLAPSILYGHIPAGWPPTIGAILDAATGMAVMLPPEERTRAVHAKLAGIAQWARETIATSGVKP